MVMSDLDRKYRWEGFWRRVRLREEKDERGGVRYSDEFWLDRLFVFLRVRKPGGFDDRTSGERFWDWLELWAMSLAVLVLMLVLGCLVSSALGSGCLLRTWMG